MANSSVRGPTDSSLSVRRNSSDVMIYEYALEPELVATWTNRKDYRYFMPSFGLGQGRIVSRYPKRWQRLVWNAPRANDDFSRMRLEALLNKLSETMVRRSDIHWDADSTSWMENSEGEHEKRPFHAILARENPRNHTHVLTELDIDELSTCRWAVESTRSVQRTAARMAGLVAPLLRCSSTVLFIDPYFRPDKLRYRKSFTAFMERIVQNRRARYRSALKFCPEPMGLWRRTSFDKSVRDYFLDVSQRGCECFYAGLQRNQTVKNSTIATSLPIWAASPSELGLTRAEREKQTMSRGWVANCMRNAGLNTVETHQQSSIKMEFQSRSREQEGCGDIPDKAPVGTDLCGVGAQRRAPRGSWSSSHNE